MASDSDTESLRQADLTASRWSLADVGGDAGGNEPAPAAESVLVLLDQADNAAEGIRNSEPSTAAAAWDAGYTYGLRLRGPSARSASDVPAGASDAAAGFSSDSPRGCLRYNQPVHRQACNRKRGRQDGPPTEDEAAILQQTVAQAGWRPSATLLETISILINAIGEQMNVVGTSGDSERLQARLQDLRDRGLLMPSAASRLSDYEADIAVTAAEKHFRTAGVSFSDFFQALQNVQAALSAAPTDP